MLFYSRRDFHAVACRRLEVRNGRNEELGTIVMHEPGDDNDDRPVLQSLFLAFFSFVSPQIDIRKDVSGFGNCP